MSQWLKKQIKDNYFLSTFNAHGKAIRLREALGETSEAFDYFYRNDPFYGCSMKTKQEIKDETCRVDNKKMNIQLQSVHSETLLVDATEAFLINIE